MDNEEIIIRCAEDVVESCNSTFNDIIEYHSKDTEIVNVVNVMQSIQNIECRLEDLLFITINIDDDISIVEEDNEEYDNQVILSVRDLSNLTICNSIIPSIWYMYNGDKSSIPMDEYLHAVNNEIPFITSLGGIFEFRYKDKKIIKRIIEILYNQKIELSKSILYTNQSLFGLADKDMNAEKEFVYETIIKSMDYYYNNIKKYYNKTIIDTLNNINFNFNNNN